MQFSNLNSECTKSSNTFMEPMHVRKKLRVTKQHHHMHHPTDPTHDNILRSDTYFGIILEYFTLFEFIQSLSLLTVYHYNFIKRHTSFQIVLRILQREFFDLTNHPLLCTSPNDAYSMIGLLYNFWREADDLSRKCDYLKHAHAPNDDIFTFISQPFLSRWCVLDKSFNLYSAKYWIKALSNSLSIPIRHLAYHVATKTIIDVRTFNKSSNETHDEDQEITFHRQTMHISTAILQHHCCRDNASPNITHYKDFMEWAIEQGYQPRINDFKPLLSSAVLYLTRDKYSVFAWCMHHSCNIFERIQWESDSDNIQNHYSEHASDVALRFFLFVCFILNQTNQVFGAVVDDLFHTELNKFCSYFERYDIKKRMKKLWSKLKYPDTVLTRRNLIGQLGLSLNTIQFMDIMGLKQ
eukprot:165723_1